MGSFALFVSALLCIASVLSSYGIVGVEGYLKYDTGSGIVDGKLNVHLVAHSHDDVGWLKTIDQYYVGSNNSIQGACVENVLDSVVMALRRDPSRKFIFAEMAFFSRWWEEQSVEIQEEVRQLVDAGRLEFVNGGWCMHDEATTHYIDMIDQTTLGHQLIKSQFNKTPRAGWQIDPFGHSAVQAYLLGARNICGSRTFGSSSQIFANAFPVHYSPPDGFHFEVNDDFNPVQDNPLLFDFNVEARVNDFIAAAMIQANVTRTNHIMWTMGDDFQYQYAESWFKQMDKLIHYVNKAVRQLEYLMGRRSTSNANTDGLGNALGIAQHHDAVTGTAKQHTTNDYAKRLAIGASETETVVDSALSCLLDSKLNGQCAGSTVIFSQVALHHCDFV
ncbi:UNVERIFIED_CONTAM: putative alpha-mannosidase [Sesamum calycinum]|uniref:Alpha-mannosidase n=1 Tax=Sesamum calycinum TaxID=2727403 RepID=A0AAW2MQE0_9LAMI